MLGRPRLGVPIAGTDQPEPLFAGTELRVASFAELVGLLVGGHLLPSSRTRAASWPDTSS
jgi:hypothetical protein